MSDASKILTVSYGTFSCTLEGFNDPFNTMKAIAEYFRDLAAGDRYFGAEPPTPDAAMLHAIAEREIHRRVEAKIQENGVILRAADDDTGIFEAPRSAAMPAPEPALAALNADQGADSVAAKLQRIRAKQAKAPAIAASAPISAALADDADLYTEDEHAEDLPLANTFAANGFVTDAFAEIASPAADQIDAPQPAAFDDQTLSSDGADIYADAFVEDMADLRVQEPHLAEAETLTEEPDQEIEPEALLDTLAQAAQVTAEPLPQLNTGPIDVLADTPEADDEFAAEFAAEIDGDSALLARLDDSLPEDFNPAPPLAGQADTIGLDDDALLASLGAMIDPEDSVEPDEDDALAAPETALQDPAPAAPEAPELDIAAFTSALAEHSATEKLVTEEPVTEEPAAEEPAAPAEVGEKLQRARARVIRIRRAEAPAEEPVETPAAPAAAPVQSAATPPASSLLSDEAEAALQAELAALEAEIDGPDAAAAPAEAAKPASALVTNLRRRLGDDNDDAAVNRLMEQTNSEMDGEATRRRQSAISHLKAAVAATQAERRVTGSEPATGADRQDAYRQDLDRAVRPSRPGAAVGRSSTAEPTRPTPLVLVSEQRIDRPRAAETAAPAADVAISAPRPVMPVRPRRIVAPTAVAAVTNADLNDDVDQDDEMMDDELTDEEEGDNVFIDSANFSEFAERLGATRLPELLEAAAVYCAEVLNRPQFSRPLVLRQVTGLPESGGATREDCLRGFGSLMRQGRIAKVGRGAFAVTEHSPYLAEVRKIAG